MLSRIFGGTRGKCRNTIFLELGHCILKLIESGWNGNAVFLEHIFIEIQQAILSVVGDAVPVAGPHHSPLIVFSSVRERAGHNLVPTVLGHVIIEIGQQPLAGEQPGSGVALVILHDIRSVVRVENLRGILPDLFKSLLLEIDFDAGLLFKNRNGFVPRLCLSSGRFLIMPYLDGGGMLLLSSAAATPGHADHSRHGKADRNNPTR